MARPRKSKTMTSTTSSTDVIDTTTTNTTSELDMILENDSAFEDTENAPPTEEESPADPPVEVTEVPADPPVEVAEVPADPPIEVTEVPSDPPVEVAEVPADPPIEVTEVPADPPAEVAEVPADPPIEVTEVPADPPIEVVDMSSMADMSGMALDESLINPTEMTEIPVEEVLVEYVEETDIPINNEFVEFVEVMEVPVQEFLVEQGKGIDVYMEEIPQQDTFADTVSDIPTDDIPNPTYSNIHYEFVNDSQSLMNKEIIVPSIIFIVPYRDRQKQYEFFKNHMKTVLEDYDPTSYKILYIHQQDNREFNRGAMKNIGFIQVKQIYPNDYQNITLVFNDIDTMPYTKNFLDYKTIPGVVKHFYGFKFTLGGIVSITAGDFERVNGFPNFWAWGYEDNMLQDRVLKAGLTIDRSQFYPVLDSNILHFPEGITRNVNRTEYDVYSSNTTEGINTIYNISSQYDESTGFVNVNDFTTNRAANSQQTFAYDLRNGGMPFKPRGKRGGAMKMLI